MPGLVTSPSSLQLCTPQRHDHPSGLVPTPFHILSEPFAPQSYPLLKVRELEMLGRETHFWTTTCAPQGHGCFAWHPLAQSPGTWARGWVGAGGLPCSETQLISGIE